MKADERFEISNNLGSRYVVELHRGLFRSRLIAYKDVRPALGGLLARRTVWNREADALFREWCDTVQASASVPIA